MRPGPGGSFVRSAARSACLVVALAAGATACGGGSAGSATTTVPTVPATRWSSGFCASYRAWTAALDDAGAVAGAAFALPDRAANKAALVVLFRTSAAATRDLVDAIGAAGIPEVEGGAALVQDLVGRFEGHERALTGIATRAEDLTTDPPDEFVRQVTDLRASYQEERAQVGTAFAALGDTEAGQALAEAVGAGCAGEDA